MRAVRRYYWKRSADVDKQNGKTCHTYRYNPTKPPPTARTPMTRTRSHIDDSSCFSAPLPCPLSVGAAVTPLVLVPLMVSLVADPLVVLIIPVVDMAVVRVSLAVKIPVATAVRLEKLVKASNVEQLALPSTVLQITIALSFVELVGIGVGLLAEM